MIGCFDSDRLCRPSGPGKRLVDSSRWKHHNSLQWYARDVVLHMSTRTLARRRRQLLYRYVRLSVCLSVRLSVTLLGTSSLLSTDESQRCKTFPKLYNFFLIQVYSERLKGNNSKPFSAILHNNLVLCGMVKPATCNYRPVRTHC